MVMKETYNLGSLREIDTVAAQILNDFPDFRVFLLSGNLGAGKTTLTQAFCRCLEVMDEVVSPTYTLINEYMTVNGNNVYHADLYRVKNTAEAIDTGIEDYMESGSYCFIEWPEILEPVLPHKFVKLDIRNNSGNRIITAEPYG